MQGKSCFNFKADDADLLKELAHITKLAHSDYKASDKL